jgi:hypothetical protein
MTGPGRAIVTPASGDPVAVAEGAIEELETSLMRILETGDAVWPAGASASASTKSMSEEVADFFQTIWEDAKETWPGAIADGAALYLKAHLELLTDSEKLGRYYEAVGKTYSDYVFDYFKGYAELLMMALHAVGEMADCGVAIDLQLIDVLGQGTTDIDFDAILAQLTGDCATLFDLIAAAGQIYAWIKTMDEHPELVLEAVLALLKTAYRVVSETLQVSVFRQWFEKHVKDPVALGQAEGMILGMLICDVIIDELLFMSAGKLVKGARWLVIP